MVAGLLDVPGVRQVCGEVAAVARRGDPVLETLDDEHRQGQRRQHRPDVDLAYHPQHLEVAVGADRHAFAACREGACRFGVRDAGRVPVDGCSLSPLGLADPFESANIRAEPDPQG